MVDNNKIICVNIINAICRSLSNCCYVFVYYDNQLWLIV